MENKNETLTMEDKKKIFQQVLRLAKMSDDDDAMNWEVVDLSFPVIWMDVYLKCGDCAVCNMKIETEHNIIAGGHRLPLRFDNIAETEAFVLSLANCIGRPQQ